MERILDTENKLDGICSINGKTRISETENKSKRNLINSTEIICILLKCKFRIPHLLILLNTRK